MGIESELVYVYIYVYMYIYIYVYNAFGPGGPPRWASTCSRMRPTSYMDAAFVLLAHKGAENWTNEITSFYPGRLTTAPTRLEFGVASVPAVI